MSSSARRVIGFDLDLALHGPVDDVTHAMRPRAPATPDATLQLRQHFVSSAATPQMIENTPDQMQRSADRDFSFQNKSG
ncbi:hypothetical protein RHEC894_CH03504 [Rhizobium sp. CIAT894]|nr:hypothetical protein RHEC894_CH03504 [Rhizobium sp. CIAT894]